MVSIANGVNLVSNGGFESLICGGDDCTYTSANNNDFPNWLIDGSVDMLTGGVPPYEGLISVDLCGFTSGTISQNLSTIPLEVYSVTFYHTGNFYGGKISHLSIT